MADCKRKTANLFDKTAEYTVGATTYNYTISGLDPNKYYTCSTNFERISGVDTASIYFNGGNSAINGVCSNTPRTFKPDSNGEIIVYIRYSASAGAPPIIDDIMEGTIWVMVNEGSTPLPYEPYGWVHSLRKYGTDTDILASLPVNIYADGNTATVDITGNTVQSDTPTPDNPVMPQGTGEKTANLLSVPDFTILANISNYSIELYNDTLPAGQYTLSLYQNDVLTSSARNTLRVYANSTVYYENTSENYHNQSGLHFLTFTINEESVARLEMWGHTLSNDCKYSDIMLNTGSEAFPYEPYGYKIPISSAGQTTPIYLGEVESTRRIKKYEFTGRESNIDINPLYSRFDVILPNAKSNGVRLTPAFCSHYQVIDDGRSINDVPDESLYSEVENRTRWFIKTTDYTTIPDFKAYLAQQYATGTPVTVWYVLTSETTGIVNEPLMKIGEYADTLGNISIPTIAGANTISVDTTVQPSEVSATYTGWHDSSVKEWDGTDWN